MTCELDHILTNIFIADFVCVRMLKKAGVYHNGKTKNKQHFELVEIKQSDLGIYGLDIFFFCNSILTSFICDINIECLLLIFEYFNKRF